MHDTPAARLPYTCLIEYPNAHKLSPAACNAFHSNPEHKTDQPSLPCGLVARGLQTIAKGMPDKTRVQSSIKFLLDSSANHPSLLGQPSLPPPWSCMFHGSHTKVLNVPITAKLVSPLCKVYGIPGTLTNRTAPLHSVQSTARGPTPLPQGRHTHLCTLGCPPFEPELWNPPGCGAATQGPPNRLLH